MNKGAISVKLNGIYS